MDIVEIRKNAEKENIGIMPTRTKICGITLMEDARCAVKHGADAIGFVFWERSTRYISPAEAGAIVAALPPFVTIVGVHVDPTAEWVEETIATAGLNLLQFHGDEPPEFCRQFSLPYLKAVRVRAGLDLLQYATRYAGATGAQGLLLDTYVEGEPGGTGHAFDWELVPGNLPLPLILSGGLHAGNVTRAVRVAQPWGVDVSSGVEAAKGIKDPEKIAAFMQGVRVSERL